MRRFTMRSMVSAIPWQSCLVIEHIVLPLVGFFLLLAVSQVGAAAGPVTVELETVPSLNEITPRADPTHLVLAVFDGERKPIPEGRVRVRLQAPDSNWPLSTDLPAVEGKRLIDIELVVADGTADWEYLFPIRGTYRLEVTTLDAKGERGQKIFRLAVKESRLKLFYLASFIVGLFFLGFCMGWWLNRARRRF
jgi:hypothetical protein